MIKDEVIILSHDLSTGITFYQILHQMLQLKFEKRDIILIFAVLFVMIGLIPFMAPIYAVIIAILVYFGVKLFVGKRKKILMEKFGEGLCANCGEKIINKKCPICDKSSNSA